MNNQEAKFILAAYRPGGQDASDPLFAEALEQVRRDPELATWFEAEQHFDAAMSEKLKGEPVPPELRANILAARKIVRPSHWLRPRAWMAAAVPDTPGRGFTLVFDPATGQLYGLSGHDDGFFKQPV